MWSFVNWTNRVYFSIMTCAYYIECFYVFVWQAFECPTWHKYTELGTLSHAIYGQILLCRDDDTGENVAIKRTKAINCKFHRPVFANALQNFVVYEDIEVERTILRTLNQTHGGHPHILKLREDFLANGCHNFVLEYCPKGDLLDLLLDQKRFSVATTRTYFHQIASAVHFMHECGYAHRDLSFENVFLDANNQCKLGDFGLAIATTARPRHIAGKSSYAAPEVYLGKPYGPAQADIWSLGMILFIMLTGDPLVEKAIESNAKYQALARSGVVQVIESNPTWRPLVPPECFDLLSKMLRIDPDERISMDEVMAHSFLL
ncbi:hypothetical protein AC1031_010748 [Aphanomyces cochlioides]|nr:hypothetical protein AC1031_010748 [Aphanomyces cochlioides]